MNLTKRDKAFLVACGYLALLFISTVVFWYVALIGGSPFTAKNIGPVNQAGALQSAFKAGEVAGIRRMMCSDRALGMSMTPALRSAAGLMFPLPSGIGFIRPGCNHIAYGFIVPQLPSGSYHFESTIRYQNNLVGRDEHMPMPPVDIEIKP